MFYQKILELWTDLFFWVLGFAIVFSILARIMPCNPKQPLYRKEIVTDLLYFFLLPLFNRIAHIALLVTFVSLFLPEVTLDSISSYFANGYGPLATLPLWAQITLSFLLTDFLLYWLHRTFHTAPLWKYHAIHHSSEHVDWLSTYRFHPINTWFSFVLVDTLMILVGFSPACIASLATFNTIYSVMVHANLNWTFGPFKYVFASPVFHRWHHTSQEEGMDKNFAPTIVLLDIVFGTFYMPEKKLPERFGAPGNNVPDNFMAQLAWPFFRK